MFYAKEYVDVCFVVEDNVIPSVDVYHLNKISKEYLDDERKNNVPERLQIKEVKKLEDVPKNWWHCCYYGENDFDDNIVDFFQDPEYKEYLRLKAKFE